MRRGAALEQLVYVGGDGRLHVDGDARALARLAPALLRADHAPLLHDPPAACAGAAQRMPGDRRISTWRAPPDLQAVVSRACAHTVERLGTPERVAAQLHSARLIWEHGM